MIRGLIIGICIGFGLRSLLQIFFARKFQHEFKEAQRVFDEWSRKRDE